MLEAHHSKDGWGNMLPQTVQRSEGMGLRAQKASSSVDIFIVPSTWSPPGVCHCDGAWLWHIHSHLPQGLVPKPKVPLMGPGLPGWVEAMRTSNTVL